MPDLAKAFAAAAEESKQLPRRPDNDTLLKIYSLYKQATVGDVTGEAPSAFDFVGRAKYDAWKAVKGMSKDDAMRAYVKVIEQAKTAQ